ncbi:MAG: glycosyltransferase family 39 protein [Anaerolineae bacterium]|nr:glycosyltransferase family 39 protein [Anaerolineae bacterium]
MQDRQKISGLLTRVSPLILVALALGLSLLEVFPGWQSLGWWLLSIQLPGIMLLLIVSHKEDGLVPLETWILGGAVGYALATIIILIVSFTAPAFSQRLLLAIFGAQTLILSVWVVLRRRNWLEARVFWARLPRTVAGWFGAIILITLVVLHVAGLSYSEYQGDEIDALEPAWAILAGNPAVLLSHQKGPTQSLVAASFIRVLDTFQEGPLRLPYALAGLWAAGALYVLTRHLFGQRIALIALALYTLNGLTLGFSRIMQYQGILFLAQIASLVCFARFAQAKTNGQALRWLGLGALLLGFAFLTHYEALLMGLVALPLLWQGRHNLSGRARWGWAMAGLIFFIMVAYYIPFFTTDSFADTAEHYRADRLRFSGLPHNNLAHFVAANLFYNSLYFGLILTLAALAGMWLAMRSDTARTGWLNLTGGTFLLGLIVLAWGGNAASAPTIIVGGSLLLPMILSVVLLPRLSSAHRLLGIWLFAYWFTYTFLVDAPGLHYYDMVAPWAIWAAIGIDWLIARIPPPLWHKLRFAAILLWMFLAVYPMLGFVLVEQELLLTFSASSPLRLWTPISKRAETVGLFGVPHREGWAAIAALYRQGALVGDYASNGGNVVPRWYIGARSSSREEPTYLFITDRPFRQTHQAEIDAIQAAGQYRPIATIQTAVRDVVKIYQRDVIAPQTITTWSLSDLIAHYNSATTVDETIKLQDQATYWNSAGRFVNLFTPPGAAIQVCPATALPLVAVWVQTPLKLVPGCNDASASWQVREIDHASGNTGWAFGEVAVTPPAGQAVPGVYWVNFQEGIQLIGSRVVPNLATNQLTVHLAWQRWSAPTTTRDYTVFVHLIDGQGNLIAQLDRKLETGEKQLWQWRMGEVIETPLVIPLPADLPTGTYTLVTGLYYWETGEPLAISLPSGETGDTFLWLGDLQLEQGTAHFIYATR